MWTYYTALQINNCLKTTPTIKVATMKIMDNFHYRWKSPRVYLISDPFAVSKDEWDTR